MQDDISEAARLAEIKLTFQKPQKLPQTLTVYLDGLPRHPTLNQEPPDRDPTSTGTWTWTGGMEVSPQSRLEIRVPVERRLLGIKSTSVTVPIDELLSSCACGQVWRKQYTKYDMVLSPAQSKPSPMSLPPSNSLPSTPSTSTSELSSTVDDITRICPRFRVLVIGKSGVGKSSLINKAFGVSAASVSKARPGVHDINDEIYSKENTRFVVHDSQGFEHGEEDNFNIVTRFIEKRKRMNDLKDKLHAIWLCIEIPCSGGRVFEVGDENMIKLQLGHVPLVIVFTKFDQLVTKKRMRLPPARLKGLSKAEITEFAKREAKDAFQQICIEPLKEVVPQNAPPYIEVSTSTGYSQTLSELVNLTYTNVQKYLAEEVSLVSAIAQRTSSDTKIYASIAVGKRKYWDGLGRSANFPGHDLKTCLSVLHKDIIAVWNFSDPKGHLNSLQFKALMSHIVEEVSERGALPSNRTLIGGVSLVSAVAGLVGALSGPAAPIVVPIVACFVFAKWVYDVYQQSGPVLRCFMAYIVDLTVILQILFIFTKGDTRPMTRKMIKAAAKAYSESAARCQIHAQIQDYTSREGIINRINRDGVLTQIIQLIEQWKISEADGVDLAASIDADILEGLRSSGDEPWDV